MKKQNKAFTLVELMIVIAIIGVLAATLLPRLQGAQERSRDSGRVTALKSTAAVMEVYFSDNGQYPVSSSSGATAGFDCLSDNAGNVDNGLVSLMKGGKAPLDPIRANQTAPCVQASPGADTAGVFGYKPLTSDSGIANNAYIMVANVEAYQKANFDNSASANIAAAGAYGDITLTESGLTSEPSGNGDNSVYIERS